VLSPPPGVLTGGRLGGVVFSAGASLLAHPAAKMPAPTRAQVIRDLK
jgi:hypothetical protein